MDGWMELRRPKHTALACQMDGVLKERRTKKRSLQGLQLKVGARRASRLLVFIYSKGRRLAIKLSAYRWLKVIQMCQSEGTAPLRKTNLSNNTSLKWEHVLCWCAPFGVTRAVVDTWLDLWRRNCCSEPKQSACTWKMIVQPPKKM